MENSHKQEKRERDKKIKVSVLQYHVRKTYYNLIRDTQLGLQLGMNQDNVDPSKLFEIVKNGPNKGQNQPLDIPYFAPIH